MPAKPTAKPKARKPVGIATPAQPVPGVSGAAVQGKDESQIRQEQAKRNAVTIPPVSVFDNYKLGLEGDILYQVIKNSHPEMGLTTGIYTAISECLPKVQYVADFQNMVRDLLHGALYSTLQRRSLPARDVIRHVLSALIFFAPKEVVPLTMATQIIAQEAIYTRLNPQIGELFSMRMMSYALGQAVPILQFNGSLGENPHFVTSSGNVEAAMRGLGEGLKAASLFVTVNSYEHALANIRSFRRGLEEGYDGIKTEMKKRMVAMFIDRVIFRNRYY